MPKNEVISGAYQGKRIDKAGGYVGDIAIMGMLAPAEIIDKSTVKKFEVLSKPEDKSTAAESSSAQATGLTRLKKIFRSKGTYKLSLIFKDGKQCVIVVDEKKYTAIMNQLSG